MYQLLRNRERIKCIEEPKKKLNENVVKADQPSKVNSLSKANSSVDVDPETRYRFPYPVYLLRYDKVFLTLREEKLRKEVSSLADFGCSNISLFRYIKNLYRLETMYFIDIDEDTLIEYSNRIDPHIKDHLSHRPTPLEVTIMKGSVADPDYRLKHVDVVTAIELYVVLYI